MKVLITGGAGFIGRWVVKKLLELGHDVLVLDNFSTGEKSNLEEFKGNQLLKVKKGNVEKIEDVKACFKDNVDICIHLAAQPDVQRSLEYPELDFKTNVIGTFNLLEYSRKNKAKFVFVSTCMVYDTTLTSKAIDENHPTKASSPYAATKICAENLALSYYHGFNMPVVILRPFNTYGPFQKTNLEGGVVTIFLQKALENKPLIIFGDGTQSRDLLYIEDCVDFIIEATFSNNINGETINAGLGQDISINELALVICKDKSKIRYIPHHHPQSEISKLLCDSSKAKDLLGWEPKVALDEGIKKTKEWIIKNKNGEKHVN